MANSTPTSHFHFSTVTGVFLQDEPTTDPGTFDYVSTNFGLIDRPYPSDNKLDNPETKTQWQRLKSYIDDLNASSPPETQYKLLFLGRHGQGLHNVAESRYGTVMWDCHYSLLPGDAHGPWHDARLTDLGKAQAQTAHDAWKTQIANKIPAPESYYVSPLIRCCETARITFSDTNLPHTAPFKPLIKELLRETLGLHTCDARSSKSVIASEYPEYVFEEGFSEEDPLHDAELRESDSARDARFYEFLSDVFRSDGNSVLSMTAHSGAITSVLSVVGHRVFPVNTGGVIPVLVKAERREGKGEEKVVEPWFGRPLCPNERS
ncbi:histidine phosphatase superfamily [Aspergillus karnatakaensis]|uniref:phosphoglycerate mutase family protein n=1 Tax=Aspergillus karnatakaensis TaxID=1810916 RepID=UPI003CCE4308